MSFLHSPAFEGVAGAVLAALVAIGIAWYQRRSANRDRKDSLPRIFNADDSPITSESPSSAKVEGAIFDSQVAVGNNINQSIAVHHHYGDQNQPQIFNPTEPSPDQISSAIEQAKPFDHAHTCDKYQGVEVRWKVFLLSITNNLERWQIFCRANRDGTGPMVSFEVSAVPPELKLADRNTIVWVCGRIYQASSTNMWLEPDPELFRIEPAENL